tara:strand:+ start:50 stop:808 length:759 start_codon:yes stop_codon:yes gene_type:complete
MNKKRKIIEDLIGSFFNEKTIDDREIFEETNLILGYFNGTLDKKDMEKVENRISNDDEFRFRLEMIKYETSKQLPKYRFIRFLMNLKSAKDWLFEALNPFKSQSSNIAVGAARPGSYLQLKYVIPASLTAVSILIVSLYLPFTASYSISELSSSRSLFINDVWRGEEYNQALEAIKPDIKLTNGTLSLNWKNTNLNTDNYILEINHSFYNTDKNYLSIENFQLEIDTLKVNITEYYGSQPISKFSGIYLLSK